MRTGRSARARRTQVAPEATSSLVDSTLRWLRLDDNVRGLRAVRAFGLAAGDRILARARAERVRGRTLYIRVSTSAWAQELHVMRESILLRMRQIPGGDEVDVLRFEVGDVEDLPDWRTPVVKKLAPPKERERPSPEASTVHEALASVTDPELRARLGELFAIATQRDRKRP